MKKQNEIQQRRDQLERQPPDKGFARSDMIVRTRWGEAPTVTIHRITDDEFDRLTYAREWPSLTWASSLLSAALAFGIPVFSETLSHRSAFIGLAALCLGAGLALLLVWLKQRKSSSESITKIRGSP